MVPIQAHISTESVSGLVLRRDRGRIFIYRARKERSKAEYVDGRSHHQLITNRVYLFVTFMT